MKNYRTWWRDAAYFAEEFEDCMDNLLDNPDLKLDFSGNTVDQSDYIAEQLWAQREGLAD